jgi:hypothetical protein
MYCFEPSITDWSGFRTLSSYYPLGMVIIGEPEEPTMLAAWRVDHRVDDRRVSHRAELGRLGLCIVTHTENRVNGSDLPGQGRSRVARTPSASGGWGPSSDPGNAAPVPGSADGPQPPETTPNRGAEPSQSPAPSGKTRDGAPPGGGRGRGSRHPSGSGAVLEDDPGPGLEQPDPVDGLDQAVVLGPRVARTPSAVSGWRSHTRR